MTQMTKGGNLALTAALLRATLFWSGGDDVPEVDASALLLQADGKVASDADFIFYNQPEHLSGTVKHAGKQTGALAYDVLDVDLAGLPETVQRVAFAASCDGGTFGQVPGLRLALSDLATGAELASFQMSADAETAFVTGELYRREGGWKFRAVGQGFATGLAGLATEYGIHVGGDDPDADGLLEHDDEPEAQVETQPGPITPTVVLPPPSFTTSTPPVSPAVPLPISEPQPRPDVEVQAASLELSAPEPVAAAQAWPSAAPEAPVPPPEAPAPPELPPPAPTALDQPVAPELPSAAPPPPAPNTWPATAQTMAPSAPPAPPAAPAPPPAQVWGAPPAPPPPPPVAPPPPAPDAWAVPPPPPPPPAAPVAPPAPEAWLAPPPPAPTSYTAAVPPAPTEASIGAPASTLDGGPIMLARHGRVDLLRQRTGPLSRVMLDLAWEPAPGRRSVDLDASVIAFDGAGKKLEIVWYQHQNEFGGALQHTGDARGEGSQGASERILVDLQRLPDEVAALVFTISSFHGHTFTDLSHAMCQLVEDTGAVIVTYDLTDTQPSTAVLMTILRRTGPGLWQLRAIGEYHDCRTVKKLVDPAARQVGIH